MAVFDVSYSVRIELEFGFYLGIYIYSLINLFIIKKE